MQEAVASLPMVDWNARQLGSLFLLCLTRTGLIIALFEPKVQKKNNMKSYTVKYRVVSSGSASNASATMMLHSPSESEAIAMLKQRGTVGRDKEIIILSIS